MGKRVYIKMVWAETFDTDDDEIAKEMAIELFMKDFAPREGMHHHVRASSKIEVYDS